MKLSINFYFTLILITFFTIGVAESNKLKDFDQDIDLKKEINACEQALIWAKKRDFKKAHTYLKSHSCPLITDLVTWLHLKEGKLPFKEYQNFIHKNPGWPWESTLRKQAEYQIYHDTPSNQILKWFQKEDPYTVQGLIHYIRVLEEKGLIKKARACLLKFWTEKDLKGTEEDRFLRSFSKYLDKTHIKVRAVRLLNEGKLESAERLLNRALPQDQLYIKCRLALQRKQEDIKRFLSTKHLKFYQDPDLAKDYLTWLRQRQDSEFENYFNDIQSLMHKNPEKFWKERYIFARETLENQDYEKTYYLATQHSLKSGINYVEAEWFCGWIALQFLNNPQKAYTHFKKLTSLVKTSISQARIHYWLGRALEQLEEPEQAKSHYQQAARHKHTFYGQQALIKLRPGLKIPIIFTDLKFSKEQQQEFEQDIYVKNIKILAHADLKGEILFFAYVYAKRQTPKHLKQQMLELIYKLAPQYAVSIAQVITEGSDDIYQASYPIFAKDLGFTNYLRNAALVHAVTRKESKFNPEEVSPAGAMGLMQLMPDTAFMVARELNIPFKKSELLENPSLNIVLGEHYLNQLFEEYNSSLLLTLGGYNAGPGSVAKWLKRFQDPRNPEIDPLDWIEILPYNETRNYIHRVLENLFIYKILIESPKDSEASK